MRFGPRLGHLEKNWQFGRWVVLSGAAWSFGLNFYPWLLASTRGTPTTAIWAVGIGVVSSANPLRLVGYQNHLGAEIADEYADGGRPALRPSVRRGSLRFAGLVAPVVVVRLFLGDEAAEFICRDKYSGLSVLVGILAIDLLVSTVAFAFSRGLFVVDRADVDFKVNLVSLAVLVGVGVWLAWAPSAQLARR